MDDVVLNLLDGKLPASSILNISANWSVRQTRANPHRVAETWYYVLDAHAKMLLKLQSPKATAPRE